MTQRNNSAPLFSVMIPTHNPSSGYFEQTVSSVVSQTVGSTRMQIEVVDDCSPDVDTEQLVTQLADDHVRVSRTPMNMGLTGCWNTCIERARGEWVHILHQDDYILPGFYAEIERLAQLHPDVGLIAVRSFIVDEQNVIDEATRRVTSLENGGHNVAELLYGNPIRCPAVVIRKKSYETHGGFRSDLCYTLDWEMWTRIVASDGGVISPQVLACYRFAAGNATDRLTREGKTIIDMAKMFDLFAQRFEDFDRKRANRTLSMYALGQAQAFDALQDRAAASRYWNFWRAHASATSKAKYYARTLYRILEGNDRSPRNR